MIAHLVSEVRHALPMIPDEGEFAPLTIGLKKDGELIVIKLAPFAPVSVLLFHLLLISLQTNKRENAGFMRVWLLDALVPAEKAVDWTVQSVRGIWTGYFALVGVRDENSRLHASHLYEWRSERVASRRLSDRYRTINILAVDPTRSPRSPESRAVGCIIVTDFVTLA